MKTTLLLPGQYRIATQPEMIETLLGSCVSVCLYNIKTGAAAMNHFLQDQPIEAKPPDIGYYGSTATEYIIGALFRMDSAPGHYQAHLFGGAAVIKTAGDTYNIGAKNIAIAKQILADYQIRIIEEVTGGTQGRRIRFNTSNNTVFCRFAGQVGKKYRKGE